MLRGLLLGHFSTHSLSISIHAGISQCDISLIKSISLGLDQANITLRDACMNAIERL